MDPKYRSLRSASDLSALNGLAFEEYLRQLFEQLGYEVEKTQASGDFGGDLVMTKDGKKTVIQAKRYSSLVGFDAVKEAHFAKTYYGADNAAVVTTSGFTPQAASAASKAGVTLIDGRRLTSLISRAFQSTYRRPVPEIGPVGRSRSRGFEFDRGEGDDAAVVLRQYHGRSATITIPEGVTEIGDYALSIPPENSPLTKPYCNVEKVSEVNLPEGLLRIGEGALACCKNLASVNLPESVRSIGRHAFASSGLVSAHIRPEVEYAEGVYRSCASLAEAAVHEGVSALPKETFSWCECLSSVSLPSSLRSIGEEAFAYCETLSSVVIPEGVEEIGYRAFYQCSALSEITLPHSLKRLSLDAFVGCAFLREGTPAELFDLSGVEVYYHDGTVLPEERVAAAYEQEAFFADNREALFALDRCWREKEKQERFFCELESVKDELSKIDEDIRSIRIVFSKKEEAEREKTVRQISQIEERISHLSLIHFYQRKDLLASIDDLRQKSEARLQAIEDELSEALSQTEERRAQLAKREEELSGEVRESRSAVKYIQQNYRLPERWIAVGRTIPESAVSNLHFGYVMNQEMKRLGYQ